MQSGLFSSRLTLRIIWMRASFSSWVPWEKLRRTILTPARTRSRKTGSVLEAGPSVATIFARRWMGDSVSAGSANGISYNSNKCGEILRAVLSVCGPLYCTRGRAQRLPIHDGDRGVRLSVRSVTDETETCAECVALNLIATLPKENAVQFRAEQCTKRRDVEPNEGGNACAE